MLSRRTSIRPIQLCKVSSVILFHCAAFSRIRQCSTCPRQRVKPAERAKGCRWHPRKQDGAQRLAAAPQMPAMPIRPDRNGRGIITLFQAATKSDTNFRLAVAAAIDLARAPAANSIRTRDRRGLRSTSAHWSCGRGARRHPRRRRCLPDIAHVQQVDEEVVGQRAGVLVKTPCGEVPALAPRARMPPTSAVISGAVSRSSWALSTSSSSADTV